MIRVARYIYTGAAWLFIAGVMLQVFLAGMAVVARQIKLYLRSQPASRAKSP